MQLVVNGITYKPAGGPEQTLLSILRDQLGLTAAKPGCGEGVCGACTVLVDGEPVRSCLVTTAEVKQRPVTTLEGLAPAGKLHPLQQAFLELAAFQCGYCTPGMIMSAAALLAADPDPGEAAIVAALEGNVCRCCAYPRIVRAVRRAAELRDELVSLPQASPEPSFDRPARPWDLVRAGERDWFAVLPDGLVVAVEPDPDEGSWSTSAGAWLHIDADGAVTAFTGKVDVGQGNRTAFSLLVSAELGVPVDAVRLVMGDTDLCPHDRGTFGSRSMTDAAPFLRGAAAAARRSLERALEPGERRVVVAAEEVGPLPAMGSARPRGGIEIVTGSAVFPSDATRPGVVPGSARDRMAWKVPAGVDEGELESYLRSHQAGESSIQEVGDVRGALAEAPVRLDATYTTAYIAHVPLETRAALAEWEGERLTVWTGTQRPFGVRAELAEELGVPEENVRVVAPIAGSAFGGKHRGEVAIEAARLARVGQPVKVHWSRAEEFEAAYVRPAAVIDVRSGAARDGTVTAWDFLNIGSGAAGIGCPYAIANQQLVFQPADSPLRGGSYRGIGATANHFARESHLDELAHRIGVDPVAFRLRHLEDDRLADVLRAAADRAGWNEQPGLGIACGVEKGAYVATCAEVNVGPDGTIRVARLVTAFDCGAIVDPDNLVNQIEGATLMGLGGALFEQVDFAQGRLVTRSLSQYRVPRFSDVPPVDVVLLDQADVPSAGAGETPIVCVAPAVANAIFAATNTRLRSLPLVPSGVC